MRNKVLIAIAISLTLIVVVVRLQFHNNLELFKTNILAYEREQISILNKTKDEHLKSLKLKNPTILPLFDNQFTDANAIEERDTTFNYFYLNESVKYKSPKRDFVECLLYKCGLDYQNEITLKQIDKKVASLKYRYDETFSLWYPQFKDSVLQSKTNKSGDCGHAFADIYLLMYNKDKWIDFERFLVTYTVEKRNNEVENKRTLGVFNGLVSSIRNQLWRSSLNYFNTTIERKRTELISNTLITKIFNSSTLGTINYRLTKVTFDRKYFDILANQAFEEQWMGNSLPQGSMPYAYCFGSGNSCDGYYCSQISVKSGGSDHLVIVKDSNGSVARHGYVKSGLTLTFNVFNGTYQVFFVSGVGWNPNKIMTFSLCGKLKGGFATEESVTKGSLIYLNNQIMTYELTLRQDGNFSAQSSSVDEAFR